MITCATCSKEYEPIFKGRTDQGHGCAVQVAEKDGRLIGTGHYGSLEFDGDEIDLTDSTSKPKPGLACDECVRQAIHAGGRIVSSIF